MQRLQAYFKTEDGNIRYMIVGTTKNEIFQSGIVHGYCGGGEYDENPVFEEEIIPMWELDGDAYFDMLDEKMGDKEFTGKCWKLLEEYVIYDKEALVYRLNKKGQKLLNETDEDYFFVGEEFKPISYGLDTYD